jgi:hypothetical protein
MGYAGYLKYLEFAAWAAAEYETAWGYFQLVKAVFTYGSMVYDVFSGNTAGHLYTMAQLSLSDAIEILGVPYFVWNGAGHLFEGIYRMYERRL